MPGSGTGTPVSTAYMVPLADAVAFVAQVVSSPCSATVETLLLQAEAAVRAYTARKWTCPRVTETRTTYAYKASTLFVDECVSATAVTDSCSAAVAHTTIAGVPGAEHLRWIELDSTSVSGAVTVTGTWGWQVIPADVQRAILLSVRTWYQNAHATLAVGFDAGDSYPRILSLPRDVLPLLDPYRAQRF